MEVIVALILVAVVFAAVALGKNQKVIYKKLEKIEEILDPKTDIIEED